MSQLKSILLAIEVSTHKRDELAKVVARAAKNMQFAQSQMAQLTGYAGDTDARWIAPGAGAKPAELIRHHYQFMDRLQYAMGMQSDAIDNLKRQWGLANQALLQAEVRLMGLHQVLKVRQMELLRHQQRLEQRQTDEFATQQYVRGRQASMTGDPS